jgi:hypothetical protein
VLFGVISSADLQFVEYFWSLVPFAFAGMDCGVVALVETEATAATGSPKLKSPTS